MLAALKSRCVEWALGLAAFIGLALASTWPLVESPASRLPMGAEGARSVPYLNLWTLDWNVRSVERGEFLGHHYWDAPIFWPERNALAMSECQPALAICAPLYWLTGSTVVCYNAYLWISLALNGFSIYCVLRQRGFRLATCVCGGVAMELLPIVHWQAGVLQLVPIWAVIWAIHAVESLIAATTSTDKLTFNAVSSESIQRSAEVPSPQFSSIVWQAVCLALSIGITFWISVHQGVLLTVLLVLVAIPLGICNCNRRLVLATTISGLLAAGLVSPLAWKHYQVNQLHGFKRERDVVQGLSAEPADYLMTYGRSLVGNDPEHRLWYLGLGVGKSLLAIVGSLLVLRRPRRWTAFVLSIGVVSILLSMGTNLQIGAFSLWELLADWMPGFAQVRSVYRFAFFAQIALVLLGVQALDQLAIKVDALRSTKPRVLLRAVLFGAMIVFALDPLPQRMMVAVAPDESERWVEKIASLPRGPMLILPIVFDGEVRDYEFTTQWMNQLRPRGVPMVNGYSGFFPDSFRELAERLALDGMSKDAEKRLREIGVRYVVVQPYYNARHDEDWSSFKLLSNSEDPVRIYELLKEEVEGEQTR